MNENRKEKMDKHFASHVKLIKKNVTYETTVRVINNYLNSDAKDSIKLACIKMEFEMLEKMLQDYNE